jgi:alkylhydroperoxidase/carboxymuconolactone decarboxylase family protein YurZ
MMTAARPTTRHTKPSLSPFSTACARRGSLSNDRRHLAAILAVDVVGDLEQALRLKAPGAIENGLRDRPRHPA